jgi:hypothetical protein
VRRRSSLAQWGPGHRLGPHDVDEIPADPFPSGHTSRQWGRMIRHPDGRVEDEPWPWDHVGSCSILAVPRGNRGETGRRSERSEMIVAARVRQGEKLRGPVR